MTDQGWEPDSVWQRPPAGQRLYESAPQAHPGPPEPIRDTGPAPKRPVRAGTLSVRAALLLLGALILLIAGGTVALHASPVRGGGARSAIVSTAPAVTTTPRAPATTSEAVVAAVVPGFQGVAVRSRGIAYDVPAGWVVDEPGVIRGYETPGGGRVSGVGATTDGKYYCEKSTRTVTFVNRRPDAPGLAAAAAQVGTDVAQLGFDSSGWTRRASPPAALTTGSGIAGQYVETSGTWLHGHAGCAAVEFSAYTFAFAGPTDPQLVLVIAAARGVPGEVTPDLARRIFGSVRLAG
ncbi:hypothetical protein ACWEVD_17105 [Nocardia thailandica]|uniref:hypothetical protein n=1 Tax=Nocardia thailandica TaxID=257275 RepID=UPI0002E93EC1|nr:hypothetical protein [Nocardia thailandica]